MPELLGIECDATGAARIGGAVRLSELADHPIMRERFAALASACEQALTPATRETETLAGSLGQRPQCPYFRAQVSCRKNGGTDCPAHDGENQTLAILEGGPCWVVHPSDPATALVALEATILVDGPDGARPIPAAAFFVLPTVRMDREIALNDGELIVAVHLPAHSAGGFQQFARVKDQASNYALVSLATVRRTDGEARMVLGGVSPRPYRVYGSVEEEAISGGLDDDTIASLAERALLDAEPLSKNGDKLEFAAVLLRDGIRAIAEG